jgi:recombination protein RecA
MKGPLAEVLPDGGFPRGGVVELMAPHNLGQGMSIALAACAASQAEGRARGGESSWCAFLDPDETLYAPAVQASGVCLERLLVVRPPRHLVARVALRIAASHVCSVIVIDVSGIPGAASCQQSLAPRSESLGAWPKIARKLALAVEKSQTTVFLLTDRDAPRPLSLPVAMRLELESLREKLLSIRIVKEKYGRVADPRRIAWTRPSVARISVPGAPPRWNQTG